MTQSALSSRAVLKLISFWDDISIMMKDLPSILSYKININFEASSREEILRSNELFSRIMKKIRSHDETRVVILSPNNRLSGFSLSDLVVGNDDYLMGGWQIVLYHNNTRHQLHDDLENKKSIISSYTQQALLWGQKNNKSTYLGTWYNSRGIKSKMSLFGGRVPFNLYSKDEIYEIASFFSYTLQSNRIPFSINSSDKFIEAKSFSFRKSSAPLLKALFLEK